MTYPINYMPFHIITRFGEVIYIPRKKSHELIFLRVKLVFSSYLFERRLVCRNRMQNKQRSLKLIMVAYPSDLAVIVCDECIQILL